MQKRPWVGFLLCSGGAPNLKLQKKNLFLLLSFLHLHLKKELPLKSQSEVLARSKQCFEFDGFFHTRWQWLDQPVSHDSNAIVYVYICLSPSCNSTLPYLPQAPATAANTPSTTAYKATTGVAQVPQQAPSTHAFKCNLAAGRHHQPHPSIPRPNPSPEVQARFPSQEQYPPQ